MTRLDRMKRGSGIKGRDDRSIGIEIRIGDTLTKINPTDPLILVKQAVRRNLNCSDSKNFLTKTEVEFFFVTWKRVPQMEKKIWKRVPILDPNLKT